MDSVKVDISNIKNYYVLKDKDGVEIKVGINSKIEGNNVTVFKNNNYGLKYTQAISLTNPIDYNNFNPTVQLLVTCEVDRKDDKSGADIFISKDAALRLGLSRYIERGLFTLRMRKEKIDYK